jgi:hypothetical protein
VNGPEHFREAERLLAGLKDRDLPAVVAEATAAVAQVHATLALAAAIVDGPAVPGPEDRDEWDGVLR